MIARIVVELEKIGIKLSSKYKSLNQYANTNKTRGPKTARSENE